MTFHYYKKRMNFNFNYFCHSNSNSRANLSFLISFLQSIKVIHTQKCIWHFTLKSASAAIKWIPINTLKSHMKSPHPKVNLTFHIERCLCRRLASRPTFLLWEDAVRMSILSKRLMHFVLWLLPYPWKKHYIFQNKNMTEIQMGAV